MAATVGGGGAELPRRVHTKLLTIVLKRLCLREPLKVDVLIKICCFVNKGKYSFIAKSSTSELVCTRRSTISQ
jgi:hypothetical protein